MKIKVSSIVLWSVVAVMLATAIGLSCADSGTAACDEANCIAQCQGAGHLGGVCRDSACFCNDTTPDADADVVPEVPDVPREDAVTPDDGTTTEDAPPPDVADDAGPDDTVIRDEGGRDDAIRDDGRRDDGSSSSDEGGGGGEDGGGEAKSGCDPLLCFMSCGGTCSVGGECVCPPH
ncbi:MAG: hypothetical protein HY905_20150 [Deltaproteobacteria bacterium]|nr:hypothetical protein [Deltaproteobacteria bacterium]